VVTPEGLPLAYEVLPGNTADKTTLQGFLERIERQYGKARRVWLMDRGVPTEEVLAEMRRADPPVRYLVGTPKAMGQLRQTIEIARVSVDSAGMVSAQPAAKARVQEYAI
jgi:transposase